MLESFDRSAELEHLTKLERALRLQDIIIHRATGRDGFEPTSYKILRAEFFDDPETRDLLPSFVRTGRQLEQLWSGLQARGGYVARRQTVREEFEPLLGHLEGTRKKPMDDDISEGLRSFDPGAVQAAWNKALQRRESDPEGAITSARTLLETVMKHILEERAVAYDAKGDLNDLYKATSCALTLAPSQHTEPTFRKILGGATTVVNELGSLRNRLSDAHGQGRGGATPNKRHASYAVNLAGATALFLIETHQDRES